MTIVVTGADGFIGVRACELLEARGYSVRRVVRRQQGPGRDRHVVPDLVEMNDWSPVLHGVDAIIHLAARAHVVRETSRDPQRAFQSANVEVTRRLAEHAVAAGVRRLVFVSSIGVNGGQTDIRPFTETDEPRPVEPYARSKLECEQNLQLIAAAGAIELVIVRPPLVYGPGVKGNLLRMLKLVASGAPLPLASIRNRRNLIGVDNLAEALALCVESPRAVGETFLLAEPEPRSTPEIFAALYEGMAQPNRLCSFPPKLLRCVATALGVRGTLDKLCSSLEVDSSKAMRVLAWRPREAFTEGMQATARWYVDGGA